MAESGTINIEVVELLQSTQKEQDINAIAIDIIDKLNCVPPALSNTYICRVHHQLRMVNEKAYEPVLLSVGPYHYSKRETTLRYMEEHKLRYLNQIIERVECEKGISKTQQLNNYLIALKKMEGKARSYYAEAITLSQHDFLKMMLMDGCFIIELFNRVTWRAFQETNKMDPLFKAPWVRGVLARDLILIENQLPFFVMEKLHTMIWDEPTSLDLIYTALQFLPIYSHLPDAQSSREKCIAQQSISNLSVEPLISSPISSKSKDLDLAKLTDIKHLLDLVRKFMLIEELLEVKSKTNQGAEQEHKVASEGPVDARVILEMKSPYPATELIDFGVRFKGIEKGKFHDIKFNDGVLEIPIILISDDTEVIFRNLIAYEEHAHGHNVKYIDDYMTFMDGLVDSPKDVELLRRHGIIYSLLGDDEVISTMFNKMGDNVVNSSEFYYKKIIHDLTTHCKKKRHAWMASLRRNYLNSPWTILSIIAASVLLIFTALQTAYATLSYYQKK